MRSFIQATSRALALVALAVSLTGCRLLEYRSIQSDFEQAVRADYEGGGYTDLYLSIATELTPEYISRLDEKLRPNAWMLRALSGWRSGQLAMARESASHGLQEPRLVPHSRDDVILQMVPGLVVDAELNQKWQTARTNLTHDVYEEFERDFKTALRELARASERMGEPTPATTRYFFYYNQWVIIRNWNAVWAALDPRDTTFKTQAFDRAEAFLGKDFEQAAAAAREKIPPDHPFGRLIRLREGK